MSPSTVFGPVPSRRLGQSLGVNTIPPKHCSYACVYCQLGRTSRMTLERRSFFEPAAIAESVCRRLAECGETGVRVDYVTVVPDGEPTLDVNLGRLLVLLASLGPPVAVITNGSLLHRADVRSELAPASWVSVKVDAADEETWHLVDRPHRRLRLEVALDGLRAFAREFDGELVTETMLVAGVNDRAETLVATLEALAEVAPKVAYLAVPTRPPAEPWVRPPSAVDLVRAHELLSLRLPRVELLTGQASVAFAPTGDLERALLAITAVHPLDEAAVVQLGHGEASLEVALRLVARGELAAVDYRGRRFFVRRLGCL